MVEWVTTFDAKYSRYRPDSLLSKINAMAGKDWVETDDELESMLKLLSTLLGKPILLELTEH